MSDIKPKTNLRLIVIVLIILAVFVGAYLIYRQTSSGGAETCDSLRIKYESAKAVEDYSKVSEYFSKMNAMGCK
jgi:hypothetical protein